MKKAKKVISLLLIVALTAVAAVSGTLAYLTATDDPKTNVFTVGNIDIELDEDVSVNGGGSVSENENGADYKDIVPGDVLEKEVTVKNTGKNDAYVAVTVTMNNGDKIAAAIDDFYEKLGKDDEYIADLYNYIFDGWGMNYYHDNEYGYDARNTITQGDTHNTDWPEYVLKVDYAETMKEYWLYGMSNWFKGEAEKEGQYWVDASVDYSKGYYTQGLEDYTWCYTYYIDLPAGKETTLFNGLRVPAEFDAEQLQMFEGLKIDVKAAAIQKDGFADAKDAFEELNKIQKDENATGASSYATYMDKCSDSALETAVAEAAAVDGKVVLPVSGEVTWTTGAAHGSTPLVTADAAVDELVIEGIGDTTLKALGKGVGPLAAKNGATLVFRNINFADESESYAEGSWEFGYLEFAGDLRFENCTFDCGIQIASGNGQYDANAVFENCTFNQKESNWYSIWIGQGNVTLNNCTINGTRGVKIHEAYGSDVDEVIVNNCDISLTEKPGVVIGDLNIPTIVKIVNSSFACTAGDQGKYIYESDTDVTTFKFTESNNTLK